MKLISSLLLACLAVPAGAARLDLEADISPSSGTLAATALVELRRPALEVTFLLHAGLEPRLETPGASLAPAEAAGQAFGINAGSATAVTRPWKLTFAKPARIFRLSYSGRISSPLARQEQDYARGFAETPGIISSDGCYLSAASGWYPVLDSGPFPFRLKTRLPSPYTAVAPGARLSRKSDAGADVTVWEEKRPVDEIALACGIYKEYRRPGKPELLAFLRSPDEDLANRYLDAAEKYTGFYASLLGPYPYAKFALVENFWNTGYGMPSYTLLGSQVIRLPFIINTSFPHEILHNWWGNGVFVDYPSGNWCEGLTAYLADYLVAENRGKGRDYRGDTLRKYAAYVRSGRDFPLTEFRSRHSPASEAVGYGKSLMFYHMLRARLGDAAFLDGLKRFYAAGLGTTASFETLRAAFEAGKPGALRAFFAQWTTRTGAPELALREAASRELYGKYYLDFTLEQVQEGPAYDLQVPVLFWSEGLEEPRRKVLDFRTRKETFTYAAPSRPLRVAVDPDYELFRRLGPLESAPALAALLGAEAPALIAEGPGWSDFAQALYRGRATDAPGDTPPAAPFWVVGQELPAATELLKGLSAYGVALGTDTLTLDGRPYALASHTFVLTAHHPADPEKTAALLVTRSTAAPAALARKLPHYGKYSWLVFDRDMNAVASGAWPASRSPLAVEFAGARPGTAGKPPAPLAALPTPFSAARMKALIEELTALPGGRAPGTEGHQKAAALITKTFSSYGLPPYQPGPPSRDARAWNNPGGFVKPPADHTVLAQVKGLSRPGEYVFVAAHFDGLPSMGGPVFPGADDNASGVAALLELARYYAARPRARTLVFAAFDGEETGRRGSKALLSRLPATAAVNAAVNLDTVGRLGSGKVLALGASSSDKWPHILRGASFVTGVEHSLVREDLDASDQASFIEKGIPALQFFTGPHADYHKASDTADKVDIAGLTRVTDLAREVIDYLAGDAEFITRPQPAAAAHGTPPAAAPRRVSTGLVPDFTYSGEGGQAGVRAQDVTPGSPLDKAGFKPGGIITHLAGRRVTGLREYSEVLKTLNPGDKIEVKTTETTLEIELK